MERGYEVFEGAGAGLIKAWTRGVPVEDAAREQVRRIAALPFVHRHVAVMPDVHLGKGATVGSVIATRGAIVPAAVGVDIGCGMVAVRTSLTSARLPESLGAVRSAIEAAIPHGRSDNGRAGDVGAWKDLPDEVGATWASLEPRFEEICARTPGIRRGNGPNHLGTLGTGNHFVEVCLDEEDRVWLMLHSGSRGVGNRIGTTFIGLARREMERWFVRLPDQDLAYLPDGTPLFGAYLRAVGWAQDFARANRALMTRAALRAMREVLGPFETDEKVVDCHHNYVEKEHHFGEEVWVTRKGAVRARVGDLGIIPGSMGTRSYIVAGKGNAESFHSCSHGAGRSMSRAEARRRFTREDHERATAGVECRKDDGVIDETPMAYKPIDAVMEAQRDLVDVVHELRQIVCVKG
ncbi:MAG: RtcB family protein [Alphaproteobacteria bacterium]|nr:RtcB family protein [Alphaproteobacteria bacterium]